MPHYFLLNIIVDFHLNWTKTNVCPKLRCFIHRDLPWALVNWTPLSRTGADVQDEVSLGKTLAPMMHPLTS